MSSLRPGLRPYPVKHVKSSRTPNKDTTPFRKAQRFR
jgi:hypothetical protein